MATRRWHTPGNPGSDSGPRLRSLIDQIAEKQRYVPPPPRYRLLVSLLSVSEEMRDFCALHRISISDAPCLQVMFVGEKADLQLLIRCFLPQERQEACLNALYLA
ncbi:hypothetical protein RYR28_002199 [Edwardsiella piscicida]|uniref:Uncharacterized protein n=3 Tax=Edwardsiella TaxID=635 RepID=A0A0H3DR95_EDWTF|nr:hypothetical protein [Edwardsiella piscicida]ACY83782.1 hypothetical protein ETAE_0937 [Edwardsiella tarda EIB202]ADM40991.1 hypothetical protein ETAF_0872 [Edwardsiella tarda FL6-60]AGH73025.1 hypothetical protein ETAC_04470 [Edwardsiella piscicida C07-087]AOP42383.1 hypothetical protein A9797_04645 [Edwardsiella piscicida]ARD17442.1 hypothetical protein BXA22_03340 [Edwardsiella piscicida]